jgi:hypothetical protein
VLVVFLRDLCDLLQIKIMPGIKDQIKKLWFTLNNKHRLVLLDYPVIPKRLYTEPDTPHTGLFAHINSQRNNYKAILSKTLQYAGNILSIREDKDKENDTDPGWNNGYFPGLDIIMLYSLLNEIRPKRYIEIGSGTSTRVAYKARKDHDLSYTITSIDPSPRKEVISIVDHREPVELQKASLDLFYSLEDGDILFFDGTHTLYPNSDVMWFFLEVLPILKKGVYVHIHDIYLPYDYPDFMCERYYNEQYILASCLLSNPDKYQVVCPNYFIYTETELHTMLHPLWNHPVLANVEKHGGSFWFRIV